VTPVHHALSDAGYNAISIERSTGIQSQKTARPGRVQVQSTSQLHGRTSVEDRVTTIAEASSHDQYPEGGLSVDRNLYKINPEQVDQDDVAADRARERRKRKEGSEKGSLSVGNHRKRDEERSRGSRSSEGSESLKDRERGRGKR
jgi:hypothetical protein